MRQLALRYAAAIVADADVYARNVGSERDVYLLAVPAMLRGVVQQIQKHLLQPLRIAGDERDLSGGLGVVHLDTGLTHQLNVSDRLDSNCFSHRQIPRALVIAAVVASMLICEMAAYYRKNGKSLYEVMNSVYEEYGYYINRTLSFEFEGASGMEKMANIMSNLRDNPPTEVSGIEVVATADYKLSVAKDLKSGTEEVINLPKSNVLSYSLADGGAVIVRPSGTEPKIKLYLTSVGKTREESLALCDKLGKDMESKLGL